MLALVLVLVLSDCHQLLGGSILQRHYCVALLDSAIDNGTGR